MKNNITFVTALYDIGRGELQSGFSRSFDHYKECFARLLKIDYPMLIYVDKSLESFVWEHRNNANTQVVIRPTEFLKDFPFYKQVQDIRQKDEWINRAGWIVDSTQAKLEMYNPLVMSKHFLLNDATLMNPFNTDYFMWVDAGISNTIGDPGYYFDSSYEKKIIKDLKKMYYLAFPYDGDVEVHGFEKTAMDRYAGEKTAYVCRGGLFGGSKEIINEFNDYYYHMLANTLDNGYMGTEESIFTILSYLHKSKCHIEMIESNGLVITYLERIKNKKIQQYDDRLAIYVLTYNLPKQLKLWCEYFDNYQKIDNYPVKKYLINNSTDRSTEPEYDMLVKEYDFEEIKFPENIGICGGRHFAAEHFAKSKHEYMIFYEDDMLMKYDNKTEKPCKNGFTPVFNNFFKTLIDIVEKEELDYIKINFTEFYGDNHDNWAWFNVPHNERSVYFKDDPKKPTNMKMSVYYTGSYRRVPYAIGEYYYCNWPILFTREGNNKVFLETVFDSKYEQTWMSFVMRLIKENKIKAGCVLGSPILHNRRYHYDGKTRKENEK